MSIEKETGVRIEIPPTTVHHQIHAPPIEWGPIYILLLAYGLIQWITRSKK